MASRAAAARHPYQIEPYPRRLRVGQSLVANGDLARCFAGYAFGAQNLLTPGANVEPVHPATKETKTMSGRCCSAWKTVEKPISTINVGRKPR